MGGKPRPRRDRVFRDPVHGIIEFPEADHDIAALLETRAVQRLRRIKQMGFASLVYPGAEHSRFGHALGAFHVATRVCGQLAIEPATARHVRVAALLHDIGHGPFSHSWEQVLAGPDHEAWGARIVTEDAELKGRLTDIEPGLPERLVQFWDKSYRPSFARKLVSSHLDVDRLDYLLRDGHYSGAGYATYDLDWILHALRLEPIHGGDDPVDLVVDYRRGKFAVEQYLFARSYMYAQVYHHKTVRAAEWVFVKLMNRFATLAQRGTEPPGLVAAAKLSRGETISVSDYLSLDDVSVTSAVSGWAGYAGRPAHDDDVLVDLARRLIDRRLFKTIDLGDDPAILESIRDRAHAAATAAFGDNAESYYHLDAAAQIGYRPGEGEELFVVGHPHYDTVHLGRLLEDLPLARRSAAARVVCAPELHDAMVPIAESALQSAARSG